MPPVPTAQPVVLVTKETPLRDWKEPLSWGVQEAPLSLVDQITPKVPTAQPCCASPKLTAFSPAGAPPDCTGPWRLQVIPPSTVVRMTPPFGANPTSVPCRSFRKRRSLKEGT